MLTNFIRACLALAVLAAFGASSTKAQTAVPTAFASGFRSPDALALDAAGNLYVASRGATNSTGRISKVTTAGNVTTFVDLPDPLYGLAFDTSGRLYFGYLDSVSRADTSGFVTTFSDGATTSTGFFGVAGLVLDAAGNVYVADLQYDSGTNTRFLRRVAPDGVTVADLATGFVTQQAIARDTAGNLYVADSGDGTIKKVTPAGGVTTFATLASPVGIAVDSVGNVYVSVQSDGIRKITPSGTVTTFVTAANAPNPRGLAFNSAGDLYISNGTGVGGTVTRIVGAAPPPAAPVPTLSEWAMILFGLGLAGAAAIHIQRRQLIA